MGLAVAPPPWYDWLLKNSLAWLDLLNTFHDSAEGSGGFTYI